MICGFHLYSCPSWPIVLKMYFPSSCSDYNNFFPSQDMWVRLKEEIPGFKSKMEYL